ncbi:hypothetical protein [Hymenobacter cheonanensis]|uniref:hypothetical protein n=1 Tax=Hymenobacter sp. CA2-7 TaxID=3063993 RepID=UPI00271233A7|nr:hypothetical protein [Hymenobacter sp. CA2-7]MDO7887113.1 hypothetical protein [Hymenobacter sp. CA2-7]
MKKLLMAGLALSTACKSGSGETQKIAAKAAPGSGSQSPPAVAAAAISSDSALTPNALAMLRRYDLSPLWANQTEMMKTHPTLEGFYGPAYYRISFYFSSVRRDARQPNVFHVEGLDRYKRVITPFVGTITVQSVRPFTKAMFADLDSTGRAFTAAGRFEFAEDPATKGAGRYAGQALLDFSLDAQGHLDHAIQLVGPDNENPTKGCGLLFRGTQVSNKTGQRHSVAFANYYGAVVPQALKSLGLGDRSEEVNPNLAKLGWNEAWENDEWWAKSPKPGLAL